jgi:hypothetical protein
LVCGYTDTRPQIEEFSSQIPQYHHFQKDGKRRLVQKLGSHTFSTPRLARASGISHLLEIKYKPDIS